MVLCLIHISKNFYKKKETGVSLLCLRVQFIGVDTNYKVASLVKSLCAFSFLSFDVCCFTGSGNFPGPLAQTRGSNTIYLFTADQRLAEARSSPRVLRLDFWPDHAKPFPIWYIAKDKIMELGEGFEPPTFTVAQWRTTRLCYPSIQEIWLQRTDEQLHNGMYKFLGDF